MKILMDTDNNKMSIEENGINKQIELYSKEAFEIISNQWVKSRLE
ncbi:hypothetical protein [Clostridium felsineum]|nr:hypothetical protein [Clostridium felsineum]URZ15999.1 hypothetical protein CLFE_020460 [Clostridium felsineum DSM 794]